MSTKPGELHGERKRGTDVKVGIDLASEQSLARVARGLSMRSERLPAQL
jgi:hypothetical protein